MSDGDKLRIEAQSTLDELFRGVGGKKVTVKVPRELVPGLIKVAKQMEK